VKTVICVSIQ